VPDPKKLQAKLHKAEAEAERDRAALRAKAEKKIARIKNELRAEDAKIAAKLERKRDKTAARLAVGNGLSDSDGTGRRPVKRRTTTKGR
jgi:regulator of protease activity HflC (stomatin/prohibitin superfamily)